MAVLVLSQFLILLYQLPVVQGTLNPYAHLHDIEGFGQVIVSSFLTGHNSFVKTTVGCQKDKWYITALPDLAQQVNTIHFRHDLVRQDQINTRLLENFHG